MFDDIPDGTFSSLRNVQYLSLQGNNIKVLRGDSFGSRTDFQLIDLSNNQIESVERKFAEQIKAQVIMMGGNVCFSGTVVHVFIMRNLDRCIRNYSA